MNCQEGKMKFYSCHFLFMLSMFTFMDYSKGATIAWASNVVLAVIVVLMFFIGDKCGEFISRKLDN